MSKLPGFQIDERVSYPRANSECHFGHPLKICVRNFLNFPWLQREKIFKYIFKKIVKWYCYGE